MKNFIDQFINEFTTIISKPRAAIFVLLLIVSSSVPLTLNAANSIYWGNEGTGLILGANLDGSGILPPLYSFEGAPCGVSIDPAGGKIYWTNFQFNGLRVANLDGTGTPSTLWDNGSNLCGVAVDHVAGKIYWSNFGMNAIRVGNLDGTGTATTLFQEAPGSAPTGVAIDPEGGKIYWSNQFTNEIRVGNLDGTGIATTLISDVNPVGVAVDHAAGKIYWVQLSPGTVRVANLDGTGITTLFSGENEPAGVAIDRSTNKIYWANFGSGQIRVGNLDGTSTAATLYNDFNIFTNFPALLKVPVSIDRPNISGGAKVGKTLTCEKGTWAPDLLGVFLYQAPRTFQYQWQLDGSNIPNAQQATFDPTKAGSYTCVVTASNQAGSTTLVSGVKKVKEK